MGTNRPRLLGLAVAASMSLAGCIGTGEGRPAAIPPAATTSAQGVATGAQPARDTHVMPTGALGSVSMTGVASTGTALRRRPDPAAPVTAPVAGPATILAAGDIATCNGTADEATARLLDRPGTIVAVGDLAYPEGSWTDFLECYGPSWGRYAARTRPVIGNHEYGSGSDDAFLAYFHGQGPVAGRTWYAFDIGSWRAYLLDSDCAEIGGCGPTSPEGRWLAADLAAHPQACSIAFMHHPRFSSGHHGDDLAVKPLWQLLYAGHAEIVVSGHDHDYERFGLMTPDGRRAPGRGTREFVVGTGGAPLRPFIGAVRANSRASNDRTHGILELRLGAAGYTWRFIPVAGSTFTDRGSGTCH